MLFQKTVNFSPEILLMLPINLGTFWNVSDLAYTAKIVVCDSSLFTRLEIGSLSNEVSHSYFARFCAPRLFVSQTPLHFYIRGVSLRMSGICRLLVWVCALKSCGDFHAHVDIILQMELAVPKSEQVKSRERSMMDSHCSVEPQKIKRSWITSFPFRTKSAHTGPRNLSEKLGLIWCILKWKLPGLSYAYRTL